MLVRIAPNRGPDTAATFVIGCGTGRCGTQSLAHLLALQPDTTATHESTLLPWRVDTAAGEAYAEALRGRAAGHRVVADVAFYLLPYVPLLRARLPDLRVVVLERDRAEVVESYLRKTPGRNHWTRPGSPHRRSERPDPVWDRCYPQYDAPKREAIGRYWDDYARVARALPSDQTHLLSTADLNDPRAIAGVLDFIGYPAAAGRPIAGIRLNAGPADAP